ncbi:MAG TPA: hypothetical protein VIJ35_00335 [Bradyrhizobium sp.]
MNIVQRALLAWLHHDDHADLAAARAAIEQRLRDEIEAAHCRMANDSGGVS